MYEFCLEKHAHFSSNLNHHHLREVFPEKKYVTTAPAQLKLPSQHRDSQARQAAGAWTVKSPPHSALDPSWRILVNVSPASQGQGHSWSHCLSPPFIVNPTCSVSFTAHPLYKLVAPQGPIHALCHTSLPSGRLLPCPLSLQSEPGALQSRACRAHLSQST